MSVISTLRASRPKVVEVPIQDGVVYVKSLSGTERHTIGTSKDAVSDLLVAAIGLCEKDGTKVFPAPEAGLNELGQMDGADVATIAQAVFKASGLIKKKDDDENPSTASQN